MQNATFNHLTTFDAELLPLYRRYLKKNRPLDQDLECTFLLAAQQGDQQALIRLMFANIGLIMQAIHHVHCPYIELGELVDAGLLGVWKAIRSFKPNRNFRFNTYAYRCIANALTDCIREYGFHEEENLKEEENADSFNASKIIERCGENDCYAPDFSLMDRAHLEFLNAILRTLPQRKAEIIRLLYGLDDNQALSANEIAQLKGITHQRVRQIRDEAIRDLKQRHQSPFAA